MFVRAERLLAGLSFRNPFVRFVLKVALLGIALTAFTRAIVCMCWTAARTSQTSRHALQIYAAGCLAAVLVEGTRPWVTGGPSSFAGFLAFSLASLPIGLAALPMVCLFFVTAPVR